MLLLRLRRGSGSLAVAGATGTRRNVQIIISLRGIFSWMGRRICVGRPLGESRRWTMSPAARGRASESEGGKLSYYL